MLNWYVLNCRPGQEDTAEYNLGSQSYEVYSPKVRVEKVIRGRLTVRTELLFPGYMFVRFDPELQPASKVNHSFGAKKLITFGDVLVPMHDRIIDKLKDKFGYHQPIAEVVVSRVAGDKVSVTGGAFRGIDAIFVQPDGKQRSIIMMTLLGKQHEFSVDNKEIA